MKGIFSLFYMIILFIISCSMQKQEADLIVINAKVYSVNQNFDIAQSFAVRENKFIAVGSNEEIQAKYSSDKIIDLKGKTVYPGFYDAHCHFYGYGLSLQKAELAGTNSFDEIIEKVKEFANEHPTGWILGRGWDQNDWEIKEFPTNEKLNEAFPDRPVVLTRVDGHAVLANNDALKRAGINIQSKVEGGKFIQKNGVLTGILIDNAESLINAAIPSMTFEMQQDALFAAQNNCFAVGLTSVNDAGLSCSTVKMIDSLQKAGSLKMRIYAMLEPSKENLEHFVIKGPYKTKNLDVRSIKLYADGALGSRGACLINDYSDEPGNRGLIVTDKKLLQDICKKAYDNDFQVATHAIGDSANRFILQIYGEILNKKNDRRWRIEHSQVIAKEDFELFRRYTIIPSVQPTHATSDMYWADKRLGPERIKYAYAYKTLLNTNGWIPLGSDFPIENINPLFGFYAAVSRKDQQKYPENGFNSDEALSREEALRGMTIWAAKSNFEENERGSIEPGKLADFVILEKDIMTIDISEVFKVKVLETYIGGEKVY